MWNRKMVGSNYKPVTSFPSGHVPGGWLRAMIHAHYVFLKDANTETFVPGIEHGLAVQRLVTQTAEHLKNSGNIRRSRTDYIPILFNHGVALQGARGYLNACSHYYSFQPVQLPFN